MLKLLIRESQYVVHVTFVELKARVVYRGLEPAIRDLKAQELKFEVYLGIATAARALEQNLKICRRNSVTAHSVSLWSSLPLTGGRIIGLGLASAFKQTYTTTQSNSSHVVVYILARFTGAPRRGMHTWFGNLPVARVLGKSGTEVARVL